MLTSRSGKGEISSWISKVPYGIWDSRWPSFVSVFRERMPGFCSPLKMKFLIVWNENFVYTITIKKYALLGFAWKSRHRDGGVIIWSKLSRPWWGYTQKKMSRASGNSLTPDWQQGNLHRTKLGPLNVDNNCVAWEVCETTGSGTKIYP